MVFVSFGLILVIFMWGIFIRYFNIFIVKVLNREMSLIFLVGVIFLFVLFLFNFFEFIDMIC